MREVINQKILTTLKTLKNKLILDDYNTLYVIKDFKYVKEMSVPKKPIFGGEAVSKEKIILTEIKIIGYNGDGKFMGTFNEDWCTTFIATRNLYYYRNNWEKFKEQLKAFGFKVSGAEETIESAMSKELNIHVNEI